MTAKRVATNVVTTYTQTFIGIVVGLFCSRWVYMALGEEQFGVFAVVGALIGFVGVLNSIMVSSIARFFAVAIGEERKQTPDREENTVNKWFNVALSIQCIMPTGLMILGYPIGIYFIRNVLTIPVEYLESSIWVFRLSILTTFFGMINVPFHAIYTAKQLIFIRNFFGILQTFVWAAEGWWLLHYSGNRLVGHAVALMLMTSLLYTSMAGLALRSFPECKINFKYWFDRDKVRELFSYASFALFGSLGNLFSNSGVAMVVNVFFGPTVNAAIGIGNQVSQKVSILSQALITAVQPEVATRIGAEEKERATRLGINISFYSAYIYLLVLFPVVFYAGDILTLWLKKPPALASAFVVIMLLESMILQITSGYMMLVHATGKIRGYQTTLGTLRMSSVLIVWVLLKYDVSVVPALAIGWMAPKIIITFGRLLFAKMLLDLPVYLAFTQIFWPTIILTLVSIAVSSLLSTTISSRFTGFLLTSVTNGVVVTIVFLMLVTREERRRLLSFVHKLNRMKAT